MRGIEKKEKEVIIVNTAQKRNTGIDLLRIVSMAMVVALHVLGQGGILGASAERSANYNIAWFLEIAAYCAVNCYALISGYVGIRAKHKASNIIMLWLQVALYSISIATIMYFTHDVVDFKYIFNACFPVTFSFYWYFTAYFAMWFFIPLMNAAINGLPKKKCGLILISTSVILLPISLVTDAFSINGGYGVLWLCYLYLIGAYISKYGFFVGTSCWKSISVYCACIVITFSYLTLTPIFWHPSSLLINYVSPFMLIAAIALLVFFINLKIPAKLTKAITLISSLSFSVYLIHTHPLVFEHVLKGKFAFLASTNPIIMTAIVFIGVIGIFVICAVIDYLRLCLFKALRIRQLLVWIETRMGAYIKSVSNKAFGLDK